VIAELCGYATATGASHPTAGNSRPDGIRNAVLGALRDAALEPKDVSFIVSSASGLPREDAVECEAIRAVFGDFADQVPVTSIRSMVGHCDAGAGALDVAAACLAARDGRLPATLNYETPDPDCNLRIVAGSAAEAGPVGLVVSAGLGSQAACIVVKRFEP